MMPFKNYEHYNEYESHITFLFIIVFNEDQKFSLSKLSLS
jgi:hypothetical protein